MKGARGGRDNGAMKHEGVRKRRGRGGGSGTAEE